MLETLQCFIVSYLMHAGKLYHQIHSGLSVVYLHPLKIRLSIKQSGLEGSSEKLLHMTRCHVRVPVT